MNITSILSKDVFITIASYLILNSYFLQCASVFFATSKVDRENFMSNDSFWFWFAHRTICCETCWLEAQVCKIYVSNAIHFWSKMCRTFAAQRRIRRQWRISFASRLMVRNVDKRVMCPTERVATGPEVESKSSGLSFEVDRLLSAQSAICEDANLRQSSATELLDQFLCLESLALERTRRTGVAHVHTTKRATTTQGHWLSFKIAVFDCKIDLVSTWRATTNSELVKAPSAQIATATSPLVSVSRRLSRALENERLLSC